MLKLAALPALTLLTGRLLGLQGIDLLALVLLASLPLSASAYVQTRQMGGAAHLLAASMTVQTLLAMATHAGRAEPAALRGRAGGQRSSTTGILQERIISVVVEPMIRLRMREWP